MIGACLLSMAVLAGGGVEMVRLKADATDASVPVVSGFSRTLPVTSGFSRTEQPPVHDHAAQQKPTAEQPKEPIPELTDEDRKAAFPDGLHGHATHDRAIHFYSLFDHLEWQAGAGNAAEWANTTWIGGDVDRLWLRADGEAHDGRIEEASVHALWGRAIARWWDVVAGIRQDFRPGSPQTWVAVGIQGLAPYWFEIEATGYVGAEGRTRAAIEVEYELLLTNRLILQPLVELEMYGKSDPERGIGRGLSSFETGLRLRYEIRREFAPYIGVTWDRKLFGTADLAREHGERPSAARVAFGVRTWF
jgi:copper resistance protein B